MVAMIVAAKSKDGEVDPAFDARVATRVPVVASALTRGSGSELEGLVRNVSIGGALFIMAGDSPPPCGTGLEVAFRLPTGALIRVVCVVRWTKVAEPAGFTSVGLQFGSLSGPSRSYLENYIEQVASAGIDPGVRAEATAKYRIAFDPTGRLNMMLAGLIMPEEAHSFVDMLELRVQARRCTRLHFELDARALSVCCSETMTELKRCFDSLAKREDVFGLFVGQGSLAMTQLMRMARDSGMADSVFAVNGPDDAARIWRQMEM